MDGLFLASQRERPTVERFATVPTAHATLPLPRQPLLDTGPGPALTMRGKIPSQDAD